MSLMLFLFIGLLGALFINIFKRSIIEMVGERNPLVQRLKNVSWFQNHWLAGIFLFLVNAGLFFTTGFVLFWLMSFLIPYVHFLVMFIAVMASLYLWIIINKAWQGTRRKQLRMSAVGSSFYLILTLIFCYKLITLKPLFPGDDTFMRALGLELGLIVTTTAFISCLLFTSYSKQKS